MKTLTKKCLLLRLMLLVSIYTSFQLTSAASELAGVTPKDKYLITKKDSAKKDPVQERVRSRINARKRARTLVHVQNGGKSARKKINNLTEEEIAQLTVADFSQYLLGKGDLLRKRWEPLPAAQRIVLAEQLVKETKPQPGAVDYSKKITDWRNFQARIRREAARRREAQSAKD